MDERRERAALDGVRVLELATVVAGPGTGKYLADFGADVIKIEAPSGDPARRMGWTGPDEDDSYFWKLVGRNKRCRTLDLKAESGRGEFTALLAGADVLIENLRPGKLEALGFGPDRLFELCPSLVVLRVTGFGQTGPYAHKPGFATLAEALSGYAALSGEPDGPPLLPPVAVTDEIAALAGAFATMVALRHAERTGEGQEVDVSLLEAMFQMMGPLVSAYAHLGYLQPRLGAGIPYTVPRGTYRCADGAWVAISTSADTVAHRVLELIGCGDDERFTTFQLRAEHREVLEQRMAAWVAARDLDLVLAEFERADAAIAPVLNMDGIFEDPHVRHRNAIIDVDGIVMQGLIAGLSRTPGRVRHPGPAAGTDPVDWRPRQP